MRPDTQITLNVLFVHSSRHQATPWLDGSTRYRCYHLAEALRHCGVHADVVALSELRLEHIDRYQTVCVLRPQSGRALDRLLKRCRQSGIRTVADIDDLIFDTQYAAVSPRVVNGQASRASVQKRFESNLLALLQFDELNVATEPLAKHWRLQSGKDNALVVANGLSARWLATPVNHPDNTQKRCRTITYLPGSSSHDKDFQGITDVLSDVLSRHDDVKLHIVGSLNADAARFPSGRVSMAPWVDYFQLPQIIASSTVTLAPLEKSPFTQAKSHIKFIESAAFGTPAICSPNHDICRHTSPGLLIARSVDEWYTALNSVLDRPLSNDTLMSMQAHIRETACARKSAHTVLNHWQTVDGDAFERAA